MGDKSPSSEVKRPALLSVSNLPTRDDKDRLATASPFVQTPASVEPLAPLKPEQPKWKRLICTFIFAAIVVTASLTGFIAVCMVVAVCRSLDFIANYFNESADSKVLLKIIIHLAKRSNLVKLICHIVSMKPQTV